ncbi:glycosyltransferase [Coraliomargarita sp. W4R53]
MKVQLSMGSWNPSHGGPFFSVGNLAKALSSQGDEVSLFAANYPHAPAQSAPVGVSLSTVEGRLVPLVRQAYLPNVRKQLNAHIREFKPDIMHDNGLWLTLNHQIAVAAQRHRIPFVLSPRGTLDPWALQYRNWKKRIALALYQRKDLERVDCFHAASQMEADNIRALGLKQPVALIPNGVDIPEESAHFEAKGLRTALFLGRMHPVKNLPNLLRAWAQVRPEGWQLKLVGTSEVGHREELEQLAAKLSISDQVLFSGPIYGESKAHILRDAQLLFLVSNSENFGLTVVEAMAAGIPVIASWGTPWTVLATERFGWHVEGEISALSTAIEEATSLSPSRLQVIGQRGRAYASIHFGWQHIASQFKSVYSWLQGRGDRPEYCK